MKKLVLLGLMFSLVFSLSGCLKEREEIDLGEINVLSELPTDEISLTFWHIYGQDKSALLDELIVEFETMYPNITIESVSYGSYTDILSKTKKAIGTGVTPDLVVGYPDHFAEYRDLGGIIPLDNFVESEEWGIDLDDFIDSYLAENQQFEDGMYSLPYSKSTEMMVYNKEFFDAQGITFEANEVLTWTDLETYADTMVGTGENQCEFLINFDSSANFFINSSRQWGAPYTNSAGEVLVDNDETKAMLTYFKGLMDENILALPIEWDESYGSNNFLAQDVCMTVGSTAGLKYNLPAVQLDEADYFEVGILPIPQFEDGTLSAMQQGPNIAILENTSDAERLAAWLFITFLTNTENSARWAIDTGYLPVRESSFQSDLYQELLNNPSPDYVYESLLANAAYSQVAYYQYDPAFAGIGQISSSKVREEAGFAMEAIYVGTKTVDEAIQDMLDQLSW